MTFTLVAAQDTFLPATQSLIEDTIGLDYDHNLACGGCVRSGYVYCRNKGDDDGHKVRPDGDRCCKIGDTDCMWGNTTKPKDIVCATQDEKFHYDHKDQTELFKDRFVMV